MKDNIKENKEQMDNVFGKMDNDIRDLNENDISFIINQLYMSDLHAPIFNTDEDLKDAIIKLLEHYKRTKGVCERILTSDMDLIDNLTQQAVMHNFTLMRDDLQNAVKKKELK